MPDKPVMHGSDHRPGGLDPTPTGPWHNVSDGGGISAWNSGTNYISGNTVTNGVFVYLCLQPNTNAEPGVNARWAWYWIIDVPLFQNSWVNQGGSLTGMRYKIISGAPNFLDKDNGSVVTYMNNHVTIEGSVTGGNDGTTIFRLPPAYTPSSDLHMSACDDFGDFASVTVQQSGDVIGGFV